MHRIAIVENDLDELERLTAILGRQGRCVPFTEGESFIKFTFRDTYDLACIGWSLPGTTGLELVRRIRAGAQAPNIPIILFTPRGCEDDEVEALLSGADDYVTKPVRELVLLARVETLMRRLTPASDAPQETHGGYVFDRWRSSVTANGEELILTAKEFHLALLLFRNIRRPLARRYIITEVWGQGADISSRTLDTHICRLKSKLGLSPGTGYNFRTVYGFGYQLEETSPPQTVEPPPAPPSPTRRREPRRSGLRRR